ncbi:SSU ribosomal protein S20p [hydrothermal vent metagenome]|uniref:SSU ribosomal protein S20p n=1 Tax=hydrothermal vent metagenome TaxID=652676 RepID=A0A1W1BWZ2_9ZZZZ
MANSAGAKKRIRQAITRNKHNSMLRARLRTFIKKVVYAIEAKEKETATTNFKALQPILDQAVSKGLVHKNNAARKKSRLNAKILAI